MGFEKKIHRDGDVTFDVPAWRRRWEDLMEKQDALPLASEREERQYVRSQEVGLKHMKSGASVRLQDDGAIELFTGDSGIRITPNGIQMFGKKIQIVGGEIDTLTTPHGLQENGKVITDGYDSFPRSKGKNKTLLDLCEASGIDVMRREDLK